MPVKLTGRLSFSIRDIDVFPSEEALQKFVDTQLKDRLETAATELYAQTSGGRAGDVFQIQPINARCVSVGGFTGYRGVDLSIDVSGTF